MTPLRQQKSQVYAKDLRAKVHEMHPGRLGAIQKSISSQIADFGCYGGMEFITNQLNVTEWNLTMFSIIFCKALTLDNVK